MIKGIDFSYGSGITAAQIKAAGYSFVCRYISTPGNPKNISKPELENYKAEGLGVVIVFETTGVDMTSLSNGISDARSAQSQLEALGAADAPCFFAADEQHEPDELDYLRGTASVVGHSRNGLYGGLQSIKAAFDAGLIAYGWQTYAWSGGVWDGRALLRQTLNGVSFHGAQVDLDEAAYWTSAKILTASDDYGQWPRPAAPTPPPPAVLTGTVAWTEGVTSFTHAADSKDGGKTWTVIA